MKKDVKNLEASIRSKLQNKAKEADRPFAEILQYYGMERFLYRFSQSPYVKKFILKGALLFTAWQVEQRRTTLDIDFLGRYDHHIDKIEKAFREICRLAVPADGLIFDPATVVGQKIKEETDYEGVRVKFLGLLEQSRIPMQIDIGFGDVIYPEPKTIQYPTLLDFPQPKLQGYPVETVVSEKFEAMIKLGELNSRMKDFYDVWLLIRRFDFNQGQLAEAMKRTFEHRKTPLPRSKPLFAAEIYDEDSDRQLLWKAFVHKNKIKDAPQKLSAVVREIESFLVF